VKIWECAQRYPEYKQALETLFEVLLKRLRITLGATSDPDLSNLFKFGDSDPDEKERQNTLEGLHLFRVLFEQTAGGTSLDPLIQKMKEAATIILGDESLKQWFDDFLTYSLMWGTVVPLKPEGIEGEIDRERRVEEGCRECERGGERD